MRKIKAWLAPFISLLLPLVPLAAQAQDYDYSTNLSTGEAAAATGVGIFFLILMVVLAVIAVASFIFWIMMFIHAASNDIPDKGVWIAVLLVSLLIGAGLIGAIVYYFVVKRKFTLNSTPATPAAAPPAKKK